MIKLLKCPFCGEDGEITEETEEKKGNLGAGTNIFLPWSHIRTFYHVKCSKCFCTLDAGWKSAQGAANEWNDRVGVNNGDK